MKEELKEHLERLDTLLREHSTDRSNYNNNISLCLNKVDIMRNILIGDRT